MTSTHDVPGNAARSGAHEACKAESALVRTLGLEDASPRRRALAATAALGAIALEVLSLGGLVPYLLIGGVPIGWTFAPALVLVACCGTTLMGRQRSQASALTFVTLVALLLIVTGTTLVGDGYASMFAGLIVVAAVEELVYRLVIPAVAGGLLQRAGVPASAARILGFVVGGAWFVVLPGHRAQWSSAITVAGFVAFATIAAVVVYRSGSVLATFLVHLCTDLLTTLYWLGDVSLHQRGLVLGAVFVLMVLAYGPAQRRHWRLRRITGPA